MEVSLKGSWVSEKGSWVCQKGFVGKSEAFHLKRNTNVDHSL